MLYHVVRRPLHSNTTNSSTQSRSHQRSGSVPPSTLMPRYHYSRTTPISPTNTSDSSLLTRTYLDEQATKPTMIATTTTNSNNTNSSNPYESFKSTIIPLVTNNRTTTPNKREFIQIPINREDGTSSTINTQTRSVPVSFISESNAVPSIGSNNNGNGSSRPTFTNLLRPTSKYFQYHFNNSTDESPNTTVTSNVPRLPSVSRRLSLTIPVTTTVLTNTDDEIVKPSIPSSSIRQIPIRLPQTTTTTTTVTSTPVNAPRVSSAVFHSSPISNALQRQKTDIGDGSSSSPSLSTIQNSPPFFDFPVSSPIRRAEVMAREAIQGITRLHQQRNSSVSDNSGNRSPTLSRRVIINLKNNQSISLDSRLSSAMKPPTIPLSSRLGQRNNHYHIPVLHEIQMPSHPATSLAESSSQPTTVSGNHLNGNYKNEFHMEIPVTITTSHDQENEIQNNHRIYPRERLPSVSNPHLNHTLKSI